MTPDSTSSAPKTQGIAQAILHIIESALPEGQQSSFRGSVEAAREKVPDSFVWSQHQCGQASGSLLYIGGSDESFRALTELLGIETAEKGYQDEVSKLLKQWLVRIVETLRTEGQLAELNVGESSWIKKGPQSGASYLLRMESGSTKVSMTVGFSPSLLQLLGEGEAVVTTQPSGQTVPMESLGLLCSLLDIELPISILFGKAQIPLGELVKFGPGTVVELDRSANDPVEIRINDQVVARGEVVAIEGNYGVRIQEVVSTKDRLWMTARLAGNLNAEGEVLCR